MEKEKINRINELAKKSREAGLSESKATEQAALRAEYIAEIRSQIRGQLDNTAIERPDGTREKVSERRKDHE